MLEADFQRKLKRSLLGHPKMGKAVIFKHADMWNAGIPDFSVTVDGKTTWLELKVAPNTPTKLQAHFIEKLKPRSMVVTAMAGGEIYCGLVFCKDLETAVDVIVTACGMETR